ELANKLQQHLTFLRESGLLSARSGEQARSELLALLHQALLARIAATVSQEEWSQLISNVVERHTDPYTAATAIAQRLGLITPPSSKVQQVPTTESAAQTKDMEPSKHGA